MLTAFVAKLIRFRKDHPVFRRPKLFQGRAIPGLGIKDIMWLNALGREMSDEEWSREHGHSVGVLLSGQGMDVHDSRGKPISDETLVLIFSAHHQKVSFHLPRIRGSRAAWELILDTGNELGFLGQRVQYPAAATIHLPKGRSLFCGTEWCATARSPMATRTVERERSSAKFLDPREELCAKDNTTLRSSSTLRLRDKKRGLLPNSKKPYIWRVNLIISRHSQVAICAQ